MNGEKYFEIPDYDQMAPFFMTIVSDSNHWLFLSSRGGLTAGRINPENAIFPYVTDDKIHDASANTGSRTILHVADGDRTYLWEPFSDRYDGVYAVHRNIYKNVPGNKVIFEEINSDLALIFRYGWFNSEQFGFIKRTELVNLQAKDREIALLDGVENILPALLNRSMQTNFSTLVDGYKKNELLEDSGIGIYSLSSVPVDKAEPSEALKATIAWSVGLDNPQYLLSSAQLDHFRNEGSVHTETDIHGQRGAYFVSQTMQLQNGAAREWYILLDTNKDQSDILHLKKQLSTGNILQKVLEDIDAGTTNLTLKVANADGLQLTADERSASRHFSNTLFNIMRGGIPDQDYRVEWADFRKFIQSANRSLVPAVDQISRGENTVEHSALLQLAKDSGDANLIRLTYEYLPFTFGRRHGDPSRPWNVFSIETKNADGSPRLYYQGNWRDIFQNWETLAFSFPGYIESMIARFVNASTPDGYNPYRITRDGFDWEVLDPHDPWSNIGYWGDHQVIYLLRLLELSEQFHPGELDNLLNTEIFAYAAVPYRIKPYQELLENPYDSITFDEKAHKLALQRANTTGSDGKLLWDDQERIVQATLTTKILVMMLAKFSNFVAEAGIWMNTQRPEWNDANNALAGWGVSMVTLYYMRRFQSFFRKLMAASRHENFSVPSDVAGFMHRVSQAFKAHEAILSGKFTGRQRRTLLDELGNAGTVYRNKVYAKGISGEKEKLSRADILQFCDLSLAYLDHSIKANEREDGLYHSYNLMEVGSSGEIIIHRLYEMLEGQVALLSSGYLDATQAVHLLQTMQKSALYREDQNSYMLYPDRALPGFMGKNIIPAAELRRSALLQEMVSKGNRDIVQQDEDGHVHFNSAFRNAAMLKAALQSPGSGKYGNLQANEVAVILDIYEKVFHHRAFTGRSGTFYKYEGLGSIYWHMVSKLLLAVGELVHNARAQGASKETLHTLREIYHEIREGLGVHKQPAQYGAFPTDPYSHTPKHTGVQQPGMTGQVKEDIRSRFAELGWIVEKGEIRIDPFLLRKEEYLTEPGNFDYYGPSGKKSSFAPGKDSLAFTYGQVPVFYHIADQDRVEVSLADGTTVKSPERKISADLSRQLFARNGKISKIDVYVKH